MINKQKKKQLYWFKGIITVALASSSLLAFANEEKANSVGRFEISRYDVEGNTLLSDQELNQMLAPFTGENQEFGAVQRAVEALEMAYRQKGYSLVRVVLPEQELNHGVVQLKVMETKIAKISVTGNHFFDESNIRRSFPALQEGQTPNIHDVSANLLLANENPAKKSTVQMQSASQNGALEAVIKVADEKLWSAAIALDNTGDQNTGRNRITGALQYANVGNLDHVLNMQYTTSVSNPEDVTIFGTGYHIPLYALGDSLDFYGIYSSVDSGVVNLGSDGIIGLGFDVSGNGSIYGARYNHNFAKKSDYTSVLSAGIDYKIYRNNISLFDIPLGNDVTTHPLSLIYTGNWTVTGTTANFMLAGSHNIPGGSHGSSEDFNIARSGATDSYNILRYGAGFAHAFSGDWQMRFILNGQATRDALVPGEQFGAGGANSVRGFLEREIIDDEGQVINLELYTPNLCPGNYQCRLLGFYDAAHLTRNDSLPDEISSQSIGSVGLGFRTNFAPRWAAQADWAHVTDGTTLSPKGSNRAHFRVIMMF